MKNILFYITFLAVLFSCQERIWDNPFDPECPKEIFTPDSFTAQQQAYEIKLTWTQTNKKITGFMIYKNVTNGSWESIAILSSEVFNRTDNNIQGGKKYGYKLVAYAGENESLEQIVYITPVLGAVLTTNVVSSVTSTSGNSGGTITSDGGAPVTARGVCYGTSQNPGISGNKTSNGTGTGSFTSSLSNLLPNSNYYVRAYATNSFGTAYGNQVSFSTTTSLAVVTTDVITVFTNNAAVFGGNVSSDGGLTVTERGICYGTSQNPTTSNNKTPLGTGEGSFSKTITNLSNNTTNYIRSYAINSKGTAYGNQVSFKTDNPLADTDGNIYKTVIIGDQVWMAENLKTTKYQDGSSIPFVTDGSIWAALTSGAYCYYRNLTSNGTIYGGLYNFHAVIDNRKLCPSGWHVPSDNEWMNLRDYLGGDKVAGGKLKEIGTEHWSEPNIGADNSTGFTALGGSWRGTDGVFYYHTGHAGWWWTSTAFDDTYALFYFISYASTDLSRKVDPYFNKGGGCSIRCIKN